MDNRWKAAIEAAAAVLLTAACAAVGAWGAFPAPRPSDLPPSSPLQGAKTAVRYTAAEEGPAPESSCQEVLDAAFDSDKALPSEAERVASYTLAASLDPVGHVVDGTGEIEWTNTSRKAVDALYVHAYLNAFRDEQSSFMAGRSRGGRGSGRLGAPGSLDVERFAVRELGGENLWEHAARADDSNDRDETDFALKLPRAIESGETVHVEVKFRARLPEIVERTGYAGSFHMVAQWFPKIAKLEPEGRFAHFPFRHLAEFYADFGKYDVTIDVPDGFTIGATGRRVSEEHKAGRRVERFVQDNVHDFAFAAWDKFEQAERVADGVSIRCLYPKGYDGVASQELQAAELGLRVFGRAYGAYPYGTLTIVHPPQGAEEAGGMEYPTLITTGGPWYAYAQAGHIRSLTLHELGHQYFYGLVATNEERWPFLDEGLTTFAEVQALDAGWDGSSLWTAGWSSGGTDAMLRYLGLPAEHDDTIAQPASAFASWRTYGLLAYARTALVVRTFDRAYEPGAMTRALGRWARRYRYQHPGPSQLLGAVRDTVGPDAERELRVALFERGWLDYAVADAGCSDGTPPKCSVTVTRRGTLSLPVEILVEDADGREHRLRWDGQSRQAELPLEGVSDIALVVIDPERRIGLDDDLANNTMRMGRVPRASRVWDRLSYAMGLATHLVSP